nr:DUF2207 domain-containing protein [Maliibacterium massiliense]
MTKRKCTLRAGCMLLLLLIAGLAPGAGLSAAPPAGTPDQKGFSVTGEATLTTIGNLLVEQTVTLEDDAHLDAEQQWTLYLPGAQHITDITLAQGDQTFKELAIDKPRPGEFLYSRAGDTGLLRLCPVADGGRVYTLRYTLRKATTVYDDVSDLSMALLRPKEGTLARYRMQVQMPAGAGESYAWWRGRQEAALHVTPQSVTLDVAASDVPDATLRIATDASRFLAAAPHATGNRLDKIQRQERARVRQAKWEAFFAPIRPLCIALILALAVVLGLLTRIRLKRFTPVQPEEPVKELPARLSHAQLAALVDYGRRKHPQRVHRDVLEAMLLDLLRRGVITADPEESGRDVVLHYAADAQEVSMEEAILLALLFDDVGKGDSVRAHVMCRYAERAPMMMDAFVRTIDEKALEALEAAGYSQTHNRKYPVSWRTLAKAGYLAGACCMMLVAQWLLAASFLAGWVVLSCVATDRLSRLTQAGEDLRAQVRSYRRYLAEIPHDGQEVLPALDDWARHYPYARALGVAPRMTTRLAALYPLLGDEAYLAQHPQARLLCQGGGPVARAMHCIAEAIASAQQRSLRSADAEQQV